MVPTWYGLTTFPGSVQDLIKLFKITQASLLALASLWFGFDSNTKYFLFQYWSEKVKKCENKGL